MEKTLYYKQILQTTVFVEFEINCVFPFFKIVPHIVKTNPCTKCVFGTTNVSDMGALTDGHTGGRTGPILYPRPCEEFIFPSFIMAIKVCANGQNGKMIGLEQCQKKMISFINMLGEFKPPRKRAPYGSRTIHHMR